MMASSPTRFEVIAAFVIGALLPVLETCRRGFSHWAVDFTTMFEDYVGGAVLLLGAWAAYTARSWGATFLAIAWGSITGLMMLSLISQLEDTIRQTADEPNNALVVVVKFLFVERCRHVDGSVVSTSEKLNPDLALLG